jgi:hypothetical protein
MQQTKPAPAAAAVAAAAAAATQRYAGAAVKDRQPAFQASTAAGGVCTPHTGYTPSTATAQGAHSMLQGQHVRRTDQDAQRDAFGSSREAQQLTVCQVLSLQQLAGCQVKLS